MASITQHNGKWRAQVYVKGTRASAVWDTKREAMAWAVRKEAELAAKKEQGHAFDDAADRYLREVSPQKSSPQWEARRFVVMREAFSGLTLSELDAPDIARWRDSRLQTVTGSTVNREINLLRHVFRVARDEWRWMENDPFRGVKLPKENEPRTANEAFADLGLNPGDTRQVMHRLGKPVKRGPTAGQNRIHIKAWVREATGLRDYPRPLWAYGPGGECKEAETIARQALEAELARLFTPLSQEAIVQGFCSEPHDVQLVSVRVTIILDGDTLNQDTYPPQPRRGDFYLENEMSRRFGRNQKRKMREEIACKQQALTRVEGLLRHTNAEKDKLVDTLSEARYILGDNVALPPEMQGNHPHPLGGDWDAAPRMKLDLREFTSTAAMAPTTFQRMRMHTLLVDWKDKTKADDRVHVRSMLDNGEVVYSLSNAALYGMPRDALQALLTREISRSIAKLMVKKLRPT